jgi:hypothetical protein
LRLKLIFKEHRYFDRNILEIIEIDLIDVYLIRTTVILFLMFGLTAIGELLDVLAAMIIQLNEIRSENTIFLARMLEHT